MNGPGGVAADTEGNVYVADYLGRNVTRIGPDGGITTVGGTSESGNSGDGGQATDAELKSPVEVAVDGAGNVYVANPVDHAVGRIDASGTFSTFAGTGEGGYGVDGGPAAEAFLNRSSGAAADAAGNVFVADTGNHRIRTIEPGARSVHSPGPACPATTAISKWRPLRDSAIR